ncbi:segregation and condensation protein ScpA [Bifidobacterium actinocoloniiforme DSM 22766]|uniref:Segregation and condensation protein A n=1 Tax=Bifidobacterium actinocoloniiforme DSM 22766 TaxID=1437605 RepID=A0A086Z0X3_9BIFI|nr:segregation/condensation protein A [Bifidobacterium actinocoloniiforme]AKV55360.1 chromosome segregation protein ScpA [Bifidobacterium actinocoloniiforme DSM 22766]KFI40173.1 segregation and condensation protein ScpA [Bifidobacterium actinocoloniiforme DSM 22766]
MNDQREAAPGFSVELDVYQGPFDALLGMLANRRLELTEVSLGVITEEFLSYVRRLDLAQSMDEASSFLDVASILVEAKSAALLPDRSGQATDEQSMEALRERDLLFARLLQYKAFKEAAERFGDQMQENVAAYPHPGQVDADIAAALPALVWTTTGEQLARLAARALANAPVSEVAVAQLHVPLVDLREQARLVRDRLVQADGRPVAFATLIADAHSRLEVVGRFLAVLVLFRQQDLQYKQAGPFEPLSLRWVGGPTSEWLERMSEEDFA